MVSDFDKKKWDLFSYKNKKILVWGLKHGKIAPYSDKLIEKLRNVYYGGVPASIILLSNGMSNGHCYDRALLMSRAFLDDDSIDVKLVYASIDSLRLNPYYKSDDPMTYDHCFVEIKDNEHDYIIDTSSGFIYDKKIYWIMEHPRVRKTNSKQSIIDFINADEEFHPENIDNDKYALPLILPNIESCYGRPTEMYSMMGIELLQREIEHFKEYIHYDDIVKEINEDMKNKGFGECNPDGLVKTFSIR